MNKLFCSGNTNPCWGIAIAQAANGLFGIPFNCSVTVMANNFHDLAGYTGGDQLHDGSCGGLVANAISPSTSIMISRSIGLSPVSKLRKVTFHLQYESSSARIVMNFGSSPKISITVLVLVTSPLGYGLQRIVVVLLR